MNHQGNSASIRVLMPASVFVIDLVKHSGRAKLQSQEIQAVLREIFSSVVCELGLQSVEFNYTGDGYFCTFTGDASAAVIDFINMAIPEVSRRYVAFGQNFRAGLDFGLIKPSNQPLSQNEEFFDSVGIRASRLLEVAEENQILCTDNFKTLFESYYPGVFSNKAREFQTKDRAIQAFTLMPQSFETAREAFRKFLVENPGDKQARLSKTYRILIVDDEPSLLQFVKMMFLRMGFEVAMAGSGEEAISIFTPGKFDLMLTDIVMPGISGLDLTRNLLSLDPALKVVIWSGYSNETSGFQCLKCGAEFFLSKPVTTFRLESVVNNVLSDWSPRSLKQHLTGICDDQYTALVFFQKLKENLLDLQETKLLPANYALRLLRHKGNHIVTELIMGIKPRCNLLHNLHVATIQFDCLIRLSYIIQRIRLGDLKLFLADYIKEQQQIYPNVVFDLSWDAEAVSAKMVELADALVLVVCELIDNAVNAIQKDGNVQVEVTFLRASRFLRIAVRDSGLGVSPAIADKIFEEGCSTKGIGRGLGLSLIKNVVTILKGQVSYEFSKGAVFTILIPLG